MAVRLSDLARKDVEDIRSHTIERWGRDQWLRYYLGLVAVFDRIKADPLTGQPRDAFAVGMRSVGHERHLVFFAPVAAAGGAPVVLRVLHQRRNLAAMAYAEGLDE